MTYFNTTDSAGRELRQYVADAECQEGKLLTWFGDADGCYSPSMLRRLVFVNKAPLTSVRRAITNLTNSGQLVKTSHQVQGPYGKPEYCWRKPHGSDEPKQEELAL